MPEPSPPPDSSVDPRPFSAGDGPRGVVLIHGLTGTPWEVRPFGDALLKRGFAVRAPLLAGHGDPEALERSSWRDWYETVETAFAELYDHGRRQVIVVGSSLGALLALRLAALRGDRLQGVVAISTPLEMPTWQRRAIRTMARLRSNRLLRDMVGMFPKSEGPDIRIRREVERSPSMSSFPYPALAEFVALQDEVVELLPHVRVPILVMHGRFDHTAPPEGSDRIVARVSSAQIRRVTLPRSFHIVGLDLDRHRASEEIVNFAVSTLGDPLAPGDDS